MMQGDGGLIAVDSRGNIVMEFKYVFYIVGTCLTLPMTTRHCGFYMHLFFFLTFSHPDLSGSSEGMFRAATDSTGRKEVAIWEEKNLLREDISAHGKQDASVAAP